MTTAFVVVTVVVVVGTGRRHLLPSLYLTFHTKESDSRCRDVCAVEVLH